MTRHHTKEFFKKVDKYEISVNQPVKDGMLLTSLLLHLVQKNMSNSMQQPIFSENFENVLENDFPPSKSVFFVYSSSSKPNYRK